MIKSSLSFKDVISHPTGFRWVEHGGETEVASLYHYQSLSHAGF